MVRFIIPPEMIDHLWKISNMRKVLVCLPFLFFASACSADDGQLLSSSQTTTKPTTQSVIRGEEVESETVEDAQLVLPTVTDIRSNSPIQEIVLWHGLDDMGTLALGEIVANYRQINPQIHVRLEYIPYDDLKQSYIQAVDSGSGPDLLLGAGEWSVMLYNLGLVAAISEEILDELQLDINPPAFKAVIYDNKPIALPYSLDGIVMFRNTAIMPNAPQNFDELVAFSQEVTKGRIIGAYLERGDIFAFAQLTACQGELLSPDGYPAFNNSSGQCWLDLLNSFEAAGPVSFNSDDDLNRFKAGTVGLIFAGTWNLPALHESLGDDLVIDPWPEFGSSHLSGYVWTENIYLNPNLTEDEFNHNLAFARYFLSPDGQAVFAKIGKIPATLYRDVQERMIFQAVAAFTKGIHYPIIPEMELYSESMHKALLAVFEENVAPSTALETAEKEILELIDGYNNHKDD